MDKNKRQEQKRKRRTRMREDKRRAKDASPRQRPNVKRRRFGEVMTPTMPNSVRDLEELATEAAERLVSWIGENDPPLPDGALTARPDDPSRLVPLTPSDATIVHGDSNPTVNAHLTVWASWTRAVRDGLVSAFDLVRANLLGHRLYYLGCLEGDVADLAALKGCFEYHLAAYDKQSHGTVSPENLIVVGDGSRRWFFCGSPVESPEGREGWVCRVVRMLALMNADWLMTYRSGETEVEGGEWHDVVAAQVVIPRLLACHASLRTASGELCGDRPTSGLDNVSNTLRFGACLAAMGTTAATWMDSPDADVPALDAVAERARRSLRKFDRPGHATDWLHPVTIDNEVWQGAEPCTRGLAAIWSEGIAKRDVG